MDYSNIIVPIGDAKEDILARKRIIYDFYLEWRKENPTQRKFNLSLKDYINIRHISVDETCTHAAKRYESTLAVLQLDGILVNARKVTTVRAKSNSNQSMFKQMIIMEHCCPGIGRVKMTVGIRRKTLDKIQYCITAIEADDIHSK